MYRCPVTRGTACVGSIGLGCQIRGGELFLLQAGCFLFPSERRRLYYPHFTDGKDGTGNVSNEVLWSTG